MFKCANLKSEYNIYGISWGYLIYIFIFKNVWLKVTRLS